MKVLVIVPCYNEQGNIGQVLDELNNTSVEGMTIVPLAVNDCSQDETLRVIKSRNCDYVDLPVNLGIGGAVQTGFRYAFANGFDAAIQFDGDGQHPSSSIGELIRPIKEGKADVVIGSRFLEREGFQSTRARRFGIRYFSMLFRLLLGKNISDGTSGFRAVNRKAIALSCDYYPDTYPEPEAIVLYHLNGLNLSEIPVVMKERNAGHSSISGISGIYYMVKVTLGILFIFFSIKSNGKRHPL
jgi:glycosyltransferase involved in cell wall biosynthesis